MSKLIEDIMHAVDVTIPDKEELTHGLHPKIDYLLLILRNVFVATAAMLFALSFFIHLAQADLRAVGYFCGAAAYIFECLAVTDCFQTKVPHPEMFMGYCVGPLYFLMGLGYIFLH